MKDVYVDPSPVVTSFVPGHDVRMLSSPSIPIELHFSTIMDCQQVTNTLKIESATSDSRIAQIDIDSVRCQSSGSSNNQSSQLSGAVQTAWSFAATLVNVSDGIHRISVDNVSTLAHRNLTTNSHDHFLLRIGQSNNPLVFPSANYSSNLLFRGANDSLYVSHKAAGANMFRYSLDFGTTYSDWELYPNGTNSTSMLSPRTWSGTRLQEWIGEHVIIQYWNRHVGSSDHVQQADLGIGTLQRQFPHAFIEGVFNQHGFDEGFANQMQISSNNRWTFDFLYEWPAKVAVNIWGINSDGQPDQTRVYGDIDGDNVLDRIALYSLIENVINITESPSSPFLGWQIVLNDAEYRYQLIPIGSRWKQLILYVLLWFVPIVTGAAAIWTFMRSFYGVKHNEVGITSKKGLHIGILGRAFKGVKPHGSSEPTNKSQPILAKSSDEKVTQKNIQTEQFSQVAAPKRLTVLIATMEYDIEDWGIKVKIGGLGVMSSLMGKNLKHQDLIWVIPW